MSGVLNCQLLQWINFMLKIIIVINISRENLIYWKTFVTKFAMINYEILRKYFICKIDL